MKKLLDLLPIAYFSNLHEYTDAIVIKYSSKMLKIFDFHHLCKMILVGVDFDKDKIHETIDLQFFYHRILLFFDLFPSFWKTIF
jgi:hypothetical protein